MTRRWRVKVASFLASANGPSPSPPRIPLTLRVKAASFAALSIVPAGQAVTSRADGNIAGSYSYAGAAACEEKGIHYTTNPALKNSGGSLRSLRRLICAILLMPPPSAGLDVGVAGVLGDDEQADDVEDDPG